MVQIQHNVLLAPLTTLGVGGAATHLARITDEAALVDAVTVAHRERLPLFVLGGGSNLLVADAGFAGLVLQVAIAGELEPVRSPGAITYRVHAGLDWDTFVRAVADSGLSGVECLAGIPGLVGASPVQNIGAYGQEVASTIVSVRALDLSTLTFLELPAAACGFGYRTSLFNGEAKGRYIITQVTFRFDPAAQPPLTYADLREAFPDGRATPLEVYHAVRAIRRRKGMLLVEGDPDTRSAGSFFKNPIVPEAIFRALSESLPQAAIPHWPAGQAGVKLSAAWLVEQAGFTRGFALGAAGISSRHSLALINRGGATAAEIVALRDAIVAGVRDRFGVTLTQEPVCLGFQS